MTPRQITWILPGLFVAALALAQAVPGEWRKESEGDGITVYSKEIPGSPLIAFRGVGTVNASITRLLSVLLDTKRAHEWIDSLESSSVVRWLTPNEYIEYNHIGTPFILKDRDFVSRVTIETNVPKRQVVVHYSPAQDELAPKTSYVRGEITHSRFTFTSIEGDTKSEVDGEIHCDPKGSVPRWIVNLFQKSWPRVTLENLRKQVAKPDIAENPKYKDLFGH